MIETAPTAPPPTFPHRNPYMMFSVMRLYESLPTDIQHRQSAPIQNTRNSRERPRLLVPQLASRGLLLGSI
jgi:hypothetical protein